MSFRARLFVAFLAAVLVPLMLLGYGVRRTLGERATAQYAGRVSALLDVLRGDLEAEGTAIARRVGAIAAELGRDSRFRLEAVDAAGSERRWLLDYGGAALLRAGLTLLQVQDSAGRILTSGHFRNEFDRHDPAVIAALAKARGVAVVEARTAERSFVALARLDSFEIGARRFFVIGGVEVDSAFIAGLARDPSFRITFGVGDPPRAADSVLRYPLVDAERRLRDGGAWIAVEERENLLADLRRSVNRWLVTALVVTVALALVLALWLSSRVSRPLRELADRTAAIDLDRLDQDFTSERSDEIGTLSTVLGEMTGRLRASSARLREAERRAAVGDMSRQITHDIKNGIAPIRHVFRHLDQVARDAPAELSAVYGERRATIESSVGYLETLARHYGRLSPTGTGARCDVNAVVREVVRDVAAGAGPVRTELAASLPEVPGDALTLRRILQNLVGNAIDSLEVGGGTVTVATSRTQGGVLTMVADTGRGMSREELDRAFDDFHTTKPDGTGLGLSVVRRLVADLGGTLRVETAPGAGTRFFVELPTASGAAT